MIFSSLTGFFGAGTIALNMLKKSPKSYLWEVPFCAGVIGFCTGTLVPYQVTRSSEKKLFKDYNAVEVK